MKNLFSKQVLSGIVIGIAVAGGLFTAVSRAQDDQKDEKLCRVDVGIPRITGGTECYYNRVMTGYRNDYLYCADLTVTCN